MATHSPLITNGGPGTVLPETPSPSSSSTTIISLSTQLIIWGMVGFILIELLAVICLLRYCCRARFIKKRKFKEREIILSDQTVKPKQQIGYYNNINNINNNNHNNSTFVNSLERNSVSSLKPILSKHASGHGEQHGLNETIMVDDFVSVYSTAPKSQRIKKVHKIQEREPERIHHSEDVYTLCFSSPAPVEPLDSNVPKQQQSYLYNGHINRPAFEIISHADQRPATPIKFEHVSELARYHDEEEAEHSYKKRYESDNSYRVTQQTRYDKYTRSNTQPTRLYYGNEKSFRDGGGEKVEWQQAYELRTTDWDRLKKLANSESDINKLNQNNNHINNNNNNNNRYEEVYLNDLDKIRTNKKLDYYQDYSHEQTEQSNKIEYFNFTSLLDDSIRLFNNNNNNNNNNKYNKNQNTKLNSDIDQHNLYTNRPTTSYKPDNAEPPVLTKKIVRDPDTNEILYVKNISENSSFGFDSKAKNVSRINVQYEQNLPKEEELEHIPKLPPPLQFQQSIAEKTSTKSNASSQRSSIISVIQNKNYSRRESNTQSAKRHESEDFRSSHEINIQPDAISITTHHRPESPENINLNDYIKKLDNIESVVGKDEYNKFNFSDLNKNMYESQLVLKETTSTENKGGLLNEIQNFSSNFKLKHVKRDSDIVDNANLHLSDETVFIERKKLNDEDRASLASSKKSAHLY